MLISEYFFRHLVTFGISHNFLRRLHEYPIVSKTRSNGHSSGTAAPLLLHNDSLLDIRRTKILTKSLLRYDAAAARFIFVVF